MVGKLAQTGAVDIHFKDVEVVKYEAVSNLKDCEILFLRKKSIIMIS